MSTVPSVVHTRRVTVVQDPDPALPPALSLLRAEPGEDVPHRLCDTLLGLGAQRLREMDFALRDEMLLRGVWTERDRDGLRHPFDVLLSPRTVDLACLGYLHHVTWQLRQALRRASRILFEHDEAAALLPLSEAERDWLARYRRAPDAENGPRERVFCRLDALARLHAPDWRASLKFVEANVVGVGGLTYAPELASAMLRHVAAPLERLDDELALEPCADPRELLVDDLVEHARSLGVARELEEVRGWIEQSGVVTMPAHAPIELRESPPWLAALVPGAYYLPPPAFGASRTGYFFIQRVPHTFADDEERRGYHEQVARRRFRNLVVHEVWPGHHVQLLRAAEHPRPLRKYRDDDVMIEGWALYCEGLVEELGLWCEEPSARPLQSLRFRALRVIVDVAIHTGQTTGCSARGRSRCRSSAGSCSAVRRHRASRG